MTYLTMEAEIDHGRIIPREPQKLPTSGRALLTVLLEVQPKPDLAKIQPLLGSLEIKMDGLSWEQEVRSEWEKS